MKTHKAVSLVLGLILVLSLTAAPVLAQDGDDPERPEGWDDYSHGNSTDPDYAMVFPQDAVRTITIRLSPENWQAMLDDMTGLYGEFGVRDGMGGARPPIGEFPEGVEPGQFDPGQLPEGFDPPQGMNPGGFPGGMNLGTDENPIWVPADIEFDGNVWTNVGIRFKGNSSLMSTWGSGNYKMPFKLDFDEFEDDYPEIDNQRFYGFKQLSFSSNWIDSSLLREKVTADIFREAGVPSAQTAFYAVYVDYGEGPVYFGLYTAVEVVDDTVIETQFADDSGNVYKPEGSGATFAAGSFDEASFDKETNQKEDDYSDILALFDALHADTRTTDPATWRSNLEAVFNVDGFLRWLAVNQVVQNWDTYGRMAHNYYLYTDPSTGLITWIPWDNNMALAEGMGGRMGGGGGLGRPRDDGAGGPGGELSIDLASVGENWPLIRYLMDDPVYHALYVQYVAETIDGVFEPARMEAIYQTLHDLIAPYVVGENGEQPGYTHLNSPAEFESALTALIEHVNERYAVAQDYLNSQAPGQGG
jgi:spore coat protein H